MHSIYSDGTTAKSVQFGYDFSAGESIALEEIYPE